MEIERFLYWTLNKPSAIAFNNPVGFVLGFQVNRKIGYRDRQSNVGAGNVTKLIGVTHHLSTKPAQLHLSPRHFKGAIAVNNPVGFVVRFWINRFGGIMGGCKLLRKR